MSPKLEWPRLGITKSLDIGSLPSDLSLLANNAVVTQHTVFTLDGKVWATAVVW